MMFPLIFPQVKSLLHIPPLQFSVFVLVVFINPSLTCIQKLYQTKTISKGHGDYMPSSQECFSYS